MPLLACDLRSRKCAGSVLLGAACFVVRLQQGGAGTTQTTTPQTEPAEREVLGSGTLIVPSVSTTSAPPSGAPSASPTADPSRGGAGTCDRSVFTMVEDCRVFGDDRNLGRYGNCRDVLWGEYCEADGEVGHRDMPALALESHCAAF